MATNIDFVGLGDAGLSVGGEPHHDHWNTLAEAVATGTNGGGVGRPNHGGPAFGYIVSLHSDC